MESFQPGWPGNEILLKYRVRLYDKSFSPVWANWAEISARAETRNFSLVIVPARATTRMTRMRRTCMHWNQINGEKNGTGVNIDVIETITMPMKKGKRRGIRCRVCIDNPTIVKRLCYRGRIPPICTVTGTEAQTKAASVTQWLPLSKSWLHPVAVYMGIGMGRFPG